MAQGPVEFVSFYIRGTDNDGETVSTIITIPLRQPIKLYDDAPRSPYRQALVRASRAAKRELGLHPCCKVHAEPDDWSDGVETFSEQAWAKQPRFVPEPEAA